MNVGDVYCSFNDIKKLKKKSNTFHNHQLIIIKLMIQNRIIIQTLQKTYA